MKKFVRSTKSGDLGILETRDGKEVVILEGRQGQAPIEYRPSDWIDETEPKPLTLLQAAEVAFSADQRLLYFLGDHVRAKKTWLSLREEDRLKFAKEGPAVPRERRLLWKCIMVALEPLRSA